MSENKESVSRNVTLSRAIKRFFSSFIEESAVIKKKKNAKILC